MDDHTLENANFASSSETYKRATFCRKRPTKYVGNQEEKIQIRLRSRGKFVLQTSKQIAEHLLCRDCEQLFSRRGEDWVLSRMARSGNSPLFNALSAAKPYSVFQQDNLYAFVGIPEIDAAKLGYFAISVFWRSSAKRWKDLNTEVGIELGPYREPLRKWLLDEGAFPKNAALVICVPPTEQAVAAVYSPRQMKNAHFHRITFYIPGVEFTLCLGNKTPAYARETCAHASPEKFIFTSPDVLTNTKKAYAEVRNRARLSKSLSLCIRHSEIGCVGMLIYELIRAALR
jgi:hypothetical protein